MSVIFVLLPAALLFAIAAVIAYAWAARSGQFDDLETPAVRVLHDEDDDAPEAAVTPAAGSATPPRAGSPPGTTDRRS